MLPKKQIANVGNIGVTGAHNHTQFFSALIITFCALALLGWAYGDGYLQRIANDMGGNFTLVFCILFVIGLLKGLADAWWLAGCINGLKAVGGNSAKLCELFRLPKASARSADTVEKEMHRRMNYRLWVLAFTASVALGFGFLGTLVGIADGALKAFQDIQITPDAISERMPQFLKGVRVALQTSVAGFWVWLIIHVVRGNVLAGSNTFFSRLDRAFLEALEGQSEEKKT